MAHLRVCIRVYVSILEMQDAEIKKKSVFLAILSNASTMDQDFPRALPV